tara:strand:+ start:384 stop:842 length:459 start_codon:yes stop_codon:yes gene_type:complete
MIKKLSILCLLPTMVYTQDYVAYHPCDFKNQTISTYQGTIESLKIEKKEVFPYYGETKKCKVLIQGKIQGIWYFTSEDYIFNSDMSENEACDRAIDNAKNKLTAEYIPESIETKKNLDCTLTKPKVECSIETINVVMPDLGLQEVKLKQCNR